ncbi:MAG: DegT/DnrJ/EryC1/StrS family aminotransferase [Micavibrio sp.]|nr:DegT/DnrJ/EryC1/StrS family aminotransferase [Micavibrio sp.]
MSNFRYPCTGRVSTKGFGAFLEEQTGASRNNLGQFTAALGKTFSAERLTLVNSGSSANLVAALALAEQLKAAGKPLEAVAAAYTFPTTLSALGFAGFNVRLVDTEEGGFNMCPAALERALLQKPATLVCVTHFLGFAAQMDRIMPLARASGAFVLQDACETMDLTGAGGIPLHKMGDMTTWSFYHPHHMSSFGGGAVIAGNDALYRLADSISHWGRACTCHIDPATCTAPKGFSHNFSYVRQGVNVEMSELNACFGRFQLQNWDALEAARKQRYDLLLAELSDIPGVKTYPRDTANGSPFVFPITLSGETSAQAAAALATQGIECRSLMGGAMTQQPAFQNMASDGTPHAIKQATQSFFVGIHQTLPLEDVAHVAAALKARYTAKKIRAA